MGVELWWLFAAAAVYLIVLFLVAYSADSGLLPRRLVTSPIVYSLSLGVYATSWTYYGSVGLADSSGYAFLNIYLGVTGAFLLGPYILKPILTLCREYQLTSIADLLAFRYGGRGTGLVVTVFMLIGILPYISLQIRAVTESIHHSLRCQAFIAARETSWIGCSDSVRIGDQVTGFAGSGRFRYYPGI